MRRLLYWFGFLGLSTLFPLIAPLSLSTLSMGVLFMSYSLAALLFYLRQKEEWAPLKPQRRVFFLSVLLSSTLAGLFAPGFLFGFPLLTFLLPDEPFFPVGIPVWLIVNGAMHGFSSTLFLAALALISYFVARDLSADMTFRQKTLEALDRETQQIRALRRSHLLLKDNVLLREHNATLYERQRIARTIHDQVGHDLTSAILQLRAEELIHPEQNSLHEIRQTLENAMEDIRKSVHDLHDQSLDLKGTVERIVDQYRFCPVEMRILLREEPPTNIHAALVMAIREGLNNTAKHSNATRVDLTLKDDENSIWLLLHDNGTDKAPASGGGLGLIAMQERVSALHGTLNISSSHGFHLYLIFRKEDKCI